MEETIKTLQHFYNVLVLYHPSEPARKRIFIVNSFIPVQNNITYLDIKGQDITNILSDTSLFTQFSYERQTGMSVTEFQKAQFDTKLDTIPTRHYQFAPDYTWEWHLSF